MIVQAINSNGEEVELLVYTSHEEMEKYWVIRGGSQIHITSIDTIFYDGIDLGDDDSIVEYDSFLVSNEESYETYNNYKDFEECIKEHIKDEYESKIRGGDE